MCRRMERLDLVRVSLSIPVPLSTSKLTTARYTNLMVAVTIPVGIFSCDVVISPGRDHQSLHGDVLLRCLDSG